MSPLLSQRSPHSVQRPLCLCPSHLYGVSSVSAVNNRLSGWHRSTTTPVFTLQPGMAPHHSVQTIPRCGRSPLCCVGIIALFCNHCQQISIQSEFLWKIKTAARLRNTRFNIDWIYSLCVPSHTHLLFCRFQLTCWTSYITILVFNNS